MNLRANPTVKWGTRAQLEALIVPKLIAGATNAAAAVLEIAQENCPVASGDLRDSGSTSVQWEGTVVQSFASFDAHHAAFVEFGTGLTGRGTYPFNLPMSGVPITSSWVYDYKEQDWIGMPARPYLRPALDTGRPRILAAFNEALGL